MGRSLRAWVLLQYQTIWTREIMIFHRYEPSTILRLGDNMSRKGIGEVDVVLESCGT